MARFQGTIGDDEIIGTRFNDIVEGKAGNDSIYGWAGDDLLKGDEGNDRIYGGRGSDDLQGDAGNDFLDGGNGSDILEGGLGNDRLLGGAGSDVFLFADVNAGRDRILDFQDGIDRIGFDLATVNSFADLDITQLASGNTLVSWDTGSVVMVGVTPAMLSAADFTC